MLNQQLFCQMMKKRKEIPEKMKKLKKPPLGGRRPANHSCIAVDFLLFTAISILRSPQDEFCRNFQLERANCPVRKLKMFDFGTFYTGFTV